MTTETAPSAQLALRTLKDAAEARGWDYTVLRSAASTGDLETLKGGRSLLTTDELLDAWAAKVAERGGTIRPAKSA